MVPMYTSGLGLMPIVVGPKIYIYIYLHSKSEEMFYILHAHVVLKSQLLPLSRVSSWKTQLLSIMEHYTMLCNIWPQPSMWTSIIGYKKLKELAFGFLPFIHLDSLLLLLLKLLPTN